VTQGPHFFMDHDVIIVTVAYRYDFPPFSTPIRVNKFLSKLNLILF